MDFLFLSDVSSSLSQKACIKLCNDHGVELFARLPTNVSYWAVKNSKPDAFDGQGVQTQPVRVSEQRLFLKLDSPYIDEFKCFETVKLSQVSKLLTLDGDSFTPVQIKNPPKIGEAPSIEALKQKLQWGIDGYHFVFTQQQINDAASMPTLSEITLNIEDVFIDGRDVEKVPMLTRPGHGIPAGSPFHVPEKHRVNQKLLDIAQLGHDIFVAQKLEQPKNLAEFVKREMNCSLKDAKSVAFFISPNPKGNVAPEYEGPFQIRYVINFEVTGCKKRYREKARELGYAEQHVEFIVRLLWKK